MIGYGHDLVPRGGFNRERVMKGDENLPSQRSKNEKGVWSDEHPLMENLVVILLALFSAIGGVCR